MGKHKYNCKNNWQRRVRGRKREKWGISVLLEMYLCVQTTIYVGKQYHPHIVIDSTAGSKSLFFLLINLNKYNHVYLLVIYYSKNVQSKKKCMLHIGYKNT